MDKEIDLEKKIKKLDNIVFKVGRYAQTVHMLTKPQVFYDDTHKQALGYQNPFYLKKAQQIKPTLYDSSIISSQHDVIPVIDDEEIDFRRNFGKHFVPQQELSAEQAFWLQTSHPNTGQSDISPIKIKAPKELHKVKNVLDNATTITNATTIALGMFKLDLDPLAHRLVKNRDAHIYYLKYTQEQADILQGIVEQA
ncbi:hypothetical protein Tco_0900574 [Tanacetum coccineum]